MPSLTVARGHLSGLKAGVIAFARTGSPNLGEFEPAIILARYGETPDEVD